MSASENKAFVHRYLDAINGKGKPASLLARYIADSDPALKEHIASGESAFPRYELIAEDMLAEEAKWRCASRSAPRTRVSSWASPLPPGRSLCRA